LFVLEALLVTWLGSRLSAARDQAQAHAHTAEKAAQLLHALLEHVPDGITIAAAPPDFPSMAYRRSALELLGRPEVSIIGKPAGDQSTAYGLLRADGMSPPPREQIPLYRASHLVETVTNEKWVRQRPDGEKRTVLPSVAPIRDGQGRVPGAISCERDITARKQAAYLALAEEFAHRAAVASDKRAYDLILSDIRLPDLDGPGLYRLLAQQPHLCQRFIFLTGDTLQSATWTCLQKSGAPCLTKPFRIAEARHAMQHAVRTGSPTASASVPQGRLANSMSVLLREGERQKIPTTVTLWTQDSAYALRPCPGCAGHRRGLAFGR
jgi:CheY-like chemotaxis protein